MLVYTYLDPDLESEPVGPIIRLWELSWRAHGWTPRLLVPRLAQHHPDFYDGASYWTQFVWALESVGPPRVAVDFRTFNNGLAPRPGIVPIDHLALYPRLGSLVSFSAQEHTLADMLTLGPYAFSKGKSAK